MQQFNDRLYTDAYTSECFERLCRMAQVQLVGARSHDEETPSGNYANGELNGMIFSILIMCGVSYSETNGRRPSIQWTKAHNAVHQVLERQAHLSTPDLALTIYESIEVMCR